MQEPLDLAIDTAGIARLTINRTNRANSLDAELTAALMAALERCAEDPNVRIIVLLAQGRTFCAGVDLNWMKKIGAAAFEDNYEDALNVAKMLHRLNTMPMPVVAVVTLMERIFGAASGWLFSPVLELVITDAAAIAART